MKEQLEYLEKKLSYYMDPADVFDALKNGEKLIVVDARKPSGFLNEHIPNAINLPHREMNMESLKELDKDYVYVTYCDGIGCNASTRGAYNMLSLGFKVKELIGGIEWWKLDGYPVEGDVSFEKVGIPECDC